MAKNILKYITGLITIIIIVGYMLPEPLVIPVKGGKAVDWNHKTFWYEPWGKSVVHKGIDIFAKKGTELLSATNGIVIYKGTLGIGGNVIVVLGPKWRIHYFAHLESSNVEAGEFIRLSQSIGKVGDTGNAKGKPDHVHYSIVTIFPYLWHWDNSTQGWKKIFYLDPSKKLLSKN